MFKNRLNIDRIKSERTDPANAIGTASFLRLETAVTTTQNAINFNVLQNVGTSQATEQRLKQTDMFTITDFAVYVYKTDATTVTSGSIAHLYSNPNPQVFTGTGEANNLMAVWNGLLQISVDRKQVVPGMDVLRTYRVGTSQKGVGSSAANNNPVQFDEWQGPNYAFASVDPEITISGSGQTDISIQLPTAVSLAGTSSTNYVVVMFRGILWQSASSAAQ